MSHAQSLHSFLVGKWTDATAKPHLFSRENKALIVRVIHDALWVEAPHQEAEQVRHLLRKMMTVAGKLKGPLKVDFRD